MTSNKQGFTLVELLVVIGIIGILAGALFPAVTGALLNANMTAVGQKGKDIYMAVTQANLEREPLGLGNLWPRDGSGNEGATTDQEEQKLIAASTTSTEYFKFLYDEENRGASDWESRVDGFDYSKLAGSGIVPASQQLQQQNNMWAIVCNMRDEMTEVLPVLITRNVDASTLLGKFDQSKTGSGSGNMVEFDQAEQKPFSNKGFVIIRKGGAIFKGKGKIQREYRVIYNNAFFESKPSGSQAADLKYLTPSSSKTPAS